ncbi:MAG: hypothetical protein L3J66_10610 [Bacteroidales bacterium]|nr:hypothetical protein [Bacteroidales bacterium]
MKINRNNYEVFLLDYLDGTLDAVLEVELMLFLEENPDIREEMEGLEEISLQSQNIRFTGKGSLKKTEIKTIAGIGEENFEEYFVAFYENDLSKKQQSGLDQFLKANPQLEAAFKLHGKLKLQKDESVVYHPKEDLKKKPVIGVWWIAGSGVAAAIALLFALFNFMPPDKVNQTGPMVLVQLTPKPPHGILTTDIPLISGARKELAVQAKLGTMETPALETVNISEISRRELLINLNEEIASTTLVLHYRSNGFLASATDETKEEEKKKGVLGRILSRNLKLLAERFPEWGKKNSSDPAFVKILDGSIIAFNTLTGSEVEMTKVYTIDGRLSGYQIESETLNINRSIPEPGNGE